MQDETLIIIIARFLIIFWLFGSIYYLFINEYKKYSYRLNSPASKKSLNVESSKSFNGNATFLNSSTPPN